MRKAAKTGEQILAAPDSRLLATASVNRETEVVRDDNVFVVTSPAFGSVPQ
jgi:hypothetical protein